MIVSTSATSQLSTKQCTISTHATSSLNRRFARDIQKCCNLACLTVTNLAQLPTNQPLSTCEAQRQFKLNARLRCLPRAVCIYLTIYEATYLTGHQYKDVACHDEELCSNSQVFWEVGISLLHRVVGILLGYLTSCVFMSILKLKH